MTQDATTQVGGLLEQLESDDPEDRLTAARVLGEIGDEQALRALRARMTVVNRELYALVVAVGKLKRKLGVK